MRVAIKLSERMARAPLLLLGGLDYGVACVGFAGWRDPLPPFSPGCREENTSTKPVGAQIHQKTQAIHEYTRSNLYLKIRKQNKTKLALNNKP